MAFLHYSLEKIKTIDVRNIPDTFPIYYSNLPEERKREIRELRPDLIEVIFPTDTKKTPDAIDIEPESDITNIIDIWEDMPAKVWKSSFVVCSVVVCKIIPKGLKKCRIHRRPFESKQLKIRQSDGSVHNVSGYFCPDCMDFFIEDDKIEGIAKHLVERNIPALIQPLSDTLNEWESKILPRDFPTEDARIYYPSHWIDGVETCPVHPEIVLEFDRYRKRYKDREVVFDTYFCPECQKYIMRKADAQELEDRCSELGIPAIEFELLRHKRTVKELKHKTGYPSILIQDGRVVSYTLSQEKSWSILTEKDTVIVANSSICSLEGHSTQDLYAIIQIQSKKKTLINCLTNLGYCQECNKFYIDLDDFRQISEKGRPIITIIDDTDTYDRVSSGDAFNKERSHLEDVEGRLSLRIREIESTPGYVRRYARQSFYDDGNLRWQKAESQSAYDEIERIDSYMPQPYGYRVDLTCGDKTEKYYLGVNDIVLGGDSLALSFNNEFGRKLVNYRTLKIKKEGKEWRVKRRRTFDISNKYLYSFTEQSDEDAIFRSGITDQFLVKVLNMRKRQHQLTDIISTVQENQNAIIDEPLQTNLIVQGCAGSGKTVVLLHRLSALKYNNPEYDFSQTVILTPNSNFNTHIKDLAGSLQLGIITRYSVEEYYAVLLERYDEVLRPSQIADEMSMNQEYVDFIYSDNFFSLFTSAYDDYLLNIRFYLSELNNISIRLERRGISDTYISDSDMVSAIKEEWKIIDDHIKLRESSHRQSIMELGKLEERLHRVTLEVSEHEKTLAITIREEIDEAAEKLSNSLSETVKEESIAQAALQSAYISRDELKVNNAEAQSALEESFHVHLKYIEQDLSQALPKIPLEIADKYTILDGIDLQQQSCKTQLEKAHKEQQEMIAESVSNIQKRLEDFRSELNAKYEQLDIRAKECEEGVSSLERRLFVTWRAEKIGALQEEISRIESQKDALKQEVNQIGQLFEAAAGVRSSADLFDLFEQVQKYVGEVSTARDILQQKIHQISELDELSRSLYDEHISTENSIQELEKQSANLLKAIDSIPSITVDTLPDFIKGIHQCLSPKSLNVEEIKRFRKAARSVASDYEKCLNFIDDTEKNLYSLRKRKQDIQLLLEKDSATINIDDAESYISALSPFIPEAPVQLRHIQQVKAAYEQAVKTQKDLSAQKENAERLVERAEANRVPKTIRDDFDVVSEYISGINVKTLFNEIYERTVTLLNDAQARDGKKLFSVPKRTHRCELFLMLRFALQYYRKTTGKEVLLCIDEGQDLSLSEYLLLQKVNSGKAIFNIYGDTNQLLKPNRGISDWQPVISILNAPEFHKLNENYRNTNQITRFCNESFEMDVLQTGADGPTVDEIERSRLEDALSKLTLNEDRIAIIIPRAADKNSYIKKDLLPSDIKAALGDNIGAGKIAITYVDEIKGIEFDTVFVVQTGMSKNEKYIGYTRALSKLIVVIDHEFDNLLNKSEILPLPIHRSSDAANLSQLPGITIGKVVKRKKKR